MPKQVGDSWFIRTRKTKNSFEESASCEDILEQDREEKQSKMSINRFMTTYILIYG